MTTTLAPESDANRVLLTGVLDAHHTSGDFVGARIAVLDADGSVTEVAAGAQAPDEASPAADTETPWAIGSVTKTFVGVVVLQLVDEGLLGLDTGIDTWFPDLPDAERITPRRLLQHTSGLNEYIHAPAVEAELEREWTADELIAVAEAAGRLGEPGGPHHYSNLNYIILGEIIEKVTGHSWREAVETRILRPLGMSSTGVLTDGEITGYTKAGDVFAQSVHKHPSIGGAAGAMKSTGRDLLRFIAELAQGSLISPQSQEAMLSMVPGDDLSQFGIVHEYGLGLERYSNPTITVVGHMGSGNVNSAFIGYDAATGAAVAVMTNTDTPGPQAFMALESLVGVASD